MKKSRYNRRREGRLTVAQIDMCRFFATSGREIKAGWVSMKFERDDHKIQTVSILEDVKERQSIISWLDNRFFALPWYAGVAKPYNMTLAKWKSIEGKMLCANRRM